MLQLTGNFADKFFDETTKKPLIYRIYSKSLELSAWFTSLIRKFVEKFSKFTVQQFAQNAFVIYLFNS